MIPLKGTIYLLIKSASLNKFSIQGGLTTGRTLRILPNTGEKVPQRVVFADEDGVVQVSFYKNI